MRNYITNEHRAIIAAATGQPCTDALVERFLATLPEHIARRHTKATSIFEAAQREYPRKVKKWTEARKVIFDRRMEIAEWEERKQHAAALPKLSPEIAGRVGAQMATMRSAQLGQRPSDPPEENPVPKQPVAPTLETEQQAWEHLIADLARTLDAPKPTSVDPVKAHWEAVTAGKLVDAVPFVDPLIAENDALRARIAELEAAPVLELSNDPPAEALMEAYPDENHAALKARILAEFASLRNMLVGHIPMTQDQLARLQALEHPKFQTWLQA